MESATESHLVTIVKRKVPHVPISDAEVEFLLKRYQLYLFSWHKILVFVTEQCDILREDASRYYKVATKKTTKSRLPVKQGKLQQTPLSNVTNDAIREELIKVLALENRLRMPKQPANTLLSVSTDDKNENTIDYFRS